MPRCNDGIGTEHWCPDDANNEGYGLCDKHQLWTFLFYAEQQANALGISVGEMLANQWLGIPLKQKKTEDA